MKKLIYLIFALSLIFASCGETEATKELQEEVKETPFKEIEEAKLTICDCYEWDLELMEKEVQKSYDNYDAYAKEFQKYGRVPPPEVNTELVEPERKDWSLKCYYILDFHEYQTPSEKKRFIKEHEDCVKNYAKKNSAKKAPTN